MTDLKRRLTNIKFEHEGAHVALVGPLVGGAANGVTTLVYKSLDKIPDDIIEKATEVSVSMNFTDFLRKFFGMYWEESIVLARALGFDGSSDYTDSSEWYKEYIDDKVAGITIMKSVWKSADIEKALSELSPEETLELLQTQETLEKAMSSALPEGDLNITSKTNEDIVKMETIEKALHDKLIGEATEEVTVLKAKVVEQEDVVKALQAEIEVFKSAAVAAKAAARKDALKAQVAEDEVEDLFKAVGELPDEAFELVVKQLAAKNALAQDSDMFVEKGVNGQGEQNPEEQDAVAAILKAKYHTSK